MLNALKTFFDNLRQCRACLGCKNVASWRSSGEKMLVDGQLVEIATLIERKPCKACNGRGTRW